LEEIFFKIFKNSENNIISVELAKLLTRVVGLAAPNLNKIFKITWWGAGAGRGWGNLCRQTQSRELRNRDQKTSPRKHIEECKKNSKKHRAESGKCWKHKEKSKF
jgi:hypothetical protein